MLMRSYYYIEPATDWSTAMPSVRVVVSHDAAQLAAYEKAALIGAGFSPAP
jgi:hypothetical protein